MIEQHPWGPLESIGRFQWEDIVRGTTFGMTSAKLIAYTLALYADNDTGRNIHPGVSRLVRDTGYNERTVRRALNYLESHGLIYRYETGRRRGDGTSHASAYALTVPQRVRDQHNEELKTHYFPHLCDGIDSGQVPVYPTWNERHPRRKWEADDVDLSETLDPQPDTHARLREVSQPDTSARLRDLREDSQPDISDAQPDICDSQPDISDSQPDISDSQVDTHAHPSLMNNSESTTTQQHLSSDSVARTRSADDEATTARATPTVAGAEEDERNRQTRELRERFKDWTP